MEPDNRDDERGREAAIKAFAGWMKTIKDSRPDAAEIERVKQAVERLLDVARGDTGQSGLVVNFLLAWWNAQECGGFDLTDLWNVDYDIAQDMVTIFSVLPRWHHYPDSSELGFGDQFKKLALMWRCERQTKA